MLLQNEKIHKMLEKASEAYYNGEPFLTDAEFDYLSEVSGFNQLGAPPKQGGKIEHYNRLYSLQKFYVGEDTPNLPDPVETPKLDGAAISITYINGSLEIVATRGDGFIGEDITHNFKGWKGVPQSIDIEYEGIIQVIGELVAPKHIENARNYAAGASRLKDREEFASRDIYFIAYGCFLDKGLRSDYYRLDMLVLEHNEFRTVLDTDLANIFPTDGKVFRVNDNNKYLDLGFTAKHPRGAYALKDKSDVDIIITTLNEVTWQVGKSGKVSPVAHFDPIVIEDATITKATLHNPGFIEDMGLCLGDKILVTRSGGIIPKVLGVAE